jgi:hypothetical protein
MVIATTMGTRAKSAERVISGTAPLASSMARAGVPKNMTLAMTSAAHERFRTRFHQFLPETRREPRAMVRYRMANCSSGGSVDEPKGVAAQALADKMHRQLKAIQTERFIFSRQTRIQAPCAGGGHFVASIPASPWASRWSALEFSRSDQREP